MCEFNGAYIVKTIVHDRGLYWLKYNHGKSQDFGYVLKNDPTKEMHYLCSFLDTLGYMACQSQWMSIQNEYHQLELPLDLINEGIWDGNLVRLAENSSLLGKIQWYCSIMAKQEYHITPLIFNNILQFANIFL